MPDQGEEEARQGAIVSALQSGAATGAGKPLKRIDTHMSRLFLDETHVFKLIRSRRHPFADMTPIATRRRACKAGLVLNRALAPELYEAVLPVVRRPDGAITIGGSGSVIDWVLKMRRFPDGALFDEIASAGRLTPDLLREAMETIAGFHAALPAVRTLGGAHHYRETIEGLRQTEGEALGARREDSASEPLFRALEQELLRRAPMIEARREAGWVRRGHGDLHLGNICLFEGRALPFDALEFDAAMATTDVLYDAAFLLMDLRARGLNALANVAMNAYWDASGQPEDALALLPLFLALRATVRMAVAAEAGDLAAAGRYRDLALEILKPSGARLVAIGGLSGTGKSTLAKALAPRLSGPCGARVLRTDMLRKGGVNKARLPDAAYTPDARAAVYRALSTRTRAGLSAGCSVIADATFLNDRARTDIETSASPGAFLGLWLRTDPALRVSRVAARRNDESDATPAVALGQIEPAALGANWRVLDAAKPTDALVEEIEQCSR